MNLIEKLRTMSRGDLASFGMNDLAFVKATRVKGQTHYAIHAADGTEMAVVPSRDLAFAVIRQHDLEAVDVH